MGETDKEVSMVADNVILLVEKKASKLIKERKFDEAEKILDQNLEKKIESYGTYHLMFQLYSLKGDYSNMIKILNRAIRYSTQKRRFFKELKRVVILDKILKDAKIV